MRFAWRARLATSEPWPRGWRSCGSSRAIAGSRCLYWHSEARAPSAIPSTFTREASTPRGGSRRPLARRLRGARGSGRDPSLRRSPAARARRIEPPSLAGAARRADRARRRARTINRATRSGRCASSSSAMKPPYDDPSSVAGPAARPSRRAARARAPPCRRRAPPRAPPPRCNPSALRRSQRGSYGA